MRQFILAMISVGGVVLLAGTMRNRGYAFADQVCAQGAFLCNNPWWVLVAIAVLAFVVTIQTIVKT